MVFLVCLKNSIERICEIVAISPVIVARFTSCTSGSLRRLRKKEKVTGTMRGSGNVTDGHFWRIIDLLKIELPALDHTLQQYSKRGTYCKWGIIIVWYSDLKILLGKKFNNFDRAQMPFEILLEIAFV